MLSSLRPFLLLASLFLSATASPLCKLQARDASSNSSIPTPDAGGPQPEATVSTYLAQKPWWAVYSLSVYSSSEALPTAAELTGYNVLLASFWLSSNQPSEKVSQFTSLSASTRAWILNDYHSHNISFLVSAFGDGDNPTSDNKDPVKVADELAAFVKQYQFDGVDIDWEDFNALAEGANAGSGKAEKWLSDFTTELRKQLPMGQYLLTHAPVAPWFTTNTTRYPKGAYTAVNKNVGSLIDWYNVQFYNQGTDYTTCPSLLTRSAAHEFPNSSLFEIADKRNAGVELDKLVIGKPTLATDAGNGTVTGPNDPEEGFINLSTLSTCLTQAKAQSWDAGVFLWEYHPDTSVPGIKTVRSGSFPV